MRAPEDIKKGLEACRTDECLEQHTSCPYSDDKLCVMHVCGDALTLIEHLEAKVPKWISVGERMPEHDTDVLVLTAPGTLSLGQNCVVAEYIHPRMEKYGVFINFYAGYDDKNILEVTHWMPLPEPPKEEQ